MSTPSEPISTADTHAYGLRHLRLGWLTLLLFICLGFTLEILLGFKINAYVNLGNETRRLMWRLAHAHGALLGLVHLAYGMTLVVLSQRGMRRRRRVSAMLTGATILLPGGFFLGGIGFFETDPGIGIFLAPLGAIALVAGVLWITLDLRGG